MNNILGIDNVMFKVGNFEEARNFYTNLLGLKESYCFADKQMVGYALGNEAPGLTLSPGNTPGGGRLWLEVPNAKDFQKTINPCIKIISPLFDIYTGQAFEIQDPWGNIIGFTDYIYKPELARKINGC
jgi:catechol 2,3-dioxygenase-like lactoylglutathione lyase family enzyme